MEFSDNRISNYYYQSYLTLTSAEKKIIVEDAKEEVMSSYKRLINQDITKNDNIVSFKKMNSSYESLNNKDFYKDHEEEIKQYVFSDITSYIGEHMLSLGFAICFDIEIAILGNLFDEKPIVFATSFCIINSDYQLKIPNILIPRYKVTNEDVGMLLTEILITRNEYTKNPSSIVTSFSDITFDYKSDTEELIDETMDVDRFCNLFLIDNNDVYSKGIGTYELIDKNDNKCTLTIKSIMEKKVNDIDDETISKIEALNCDNVKDVVKKLKDEYADTFTINYGVMKVLDELMLVNDFDFDRYVINNYLGQNYQTDEEARANLSKDDKEAMTVKFITSIILAQHIIDMNKYIDKMHEEYNLLSITTGNDTIGSFDDFFETRSLMYVLYDYFLEKNLIERSKSWKIKF